MKDFNNIEADPIPEGLEFNESYMHDAFAMYDAEKRKRKRRLLIWWITSALGFSSVLLVGIFFFTREEADPHSMKQAADKKAPVQQLSADADPVVTKQAQAGETQSQHTQAVSGTDQNRVTASSTLKSKFSKRLNTATADRKLKSGSSVKTNRNTKHLTDKGIAERTGNDKQNPDDLPFSNGKIPENAVQPEADRTADSETSKPLVEPVNLPSKPALLAFADDSASNLPVSDQQIPLPVAENDISKHHVFLNLGVNTLFGMKELKNRATFRESIGVSYNYRFNPKLAIGAGLEYHSISRISYKRKIGDTTNSDKTTTILNKTTLNYISFSPRIHYQFWPNHTLSAGFGIEYLLVDPGERYEIDNYTQETPKRTNSKLYYSTFNRFNFSVSLGYTYQFSRFMAVHASYYYGFTDITINTDFNKTFDRNSRLQIGLNIKLH
jgi:hypothetical protein